MRQNIQLLLVWRCETRLGITICMNAEINLLPHRKRGVLSQEQVLAYSKVGAIVSCVITVSLAVMLFLLNRDPSLAQIHAQQQTLLAQLNLLHTKTAKNLIIQDRVKRITKTLQTRKSLDKTIAEIQKQLPTGVTVVSFVLDEKTLSMTVTASSLAPLGTFMDSLTKDVQDKKLFKKTTIQGVISDEKTGTFLLSITGDVL